MPMDEWDLKSDGCLWREALNAFHDDPEMTITATIMVDRLQDGANRKNPVELILYDSLAANYLRTIATGRYQSAHVRLGKESIRNATQDKTPEQRQLALLCASLPRADVLDVFLKVDGMLESQKIKTLRLLLDLAREDRAKKKS